MPETETQPHPPPARELPALSTWLVDGYNVLHAVLLGGESREDWWREPARRRLIDRAADLTDRDAHIWIVFDGSRPGDPLDPSGDARSDVARVHVVFAPSADDWLVARARATADPTTVGVVTADHKVAGRCRHAGATILSPRDFLAHCRPTPPPT